MAKELDFQDYKATTEDADGDKHESTVRAAVVTKETATVKNADGRDVPREVVTPTGSRTVQVGDVLVETDRPGVYDYLGADAWASTGYGKGAAKKAASAASKRSSKASDAPAQGADSNPETSTPEHSEQPKRTLPGNDNS